MFARSKEMIIIFERSGRWFYCQGFYQKKSIFTSEFILEHFGTGTKPSNVKWLSSSDNPCSQLQSELTAKCLDLAIDTYKFNSNNICKEKPSADLNNNSQLSMFV